MSVSGVRSASNSTLIVGLLFCQGIVPPFSMVPNGAIKQGQGGVKISSFPRKWKTPPSHSFDRLKETVLLAAGMDEFRPFPLILNAMYIFRVEQVHTLGTLGPLESHLDLT